MRWLSFYRSAPDLSEGSRYTQATFGYIVPAGTASDGQEGVVDVLATVVAGVGHPDKIARNDRR